LGGVKSAVNIHCQSVLTETWGGRITGGHPKHLEPRRKSSSVSLSAL